MAGALPFAPSRVTIGVGTRFYDRGRRLLPRLVSTPGAFVSVGEGMSRRDDPKR